MVLLVCQHCDYRWDYLGDNEHYATCPRCRYKVRITEDQAKLLLQKRLVDERATIPLSKESVKLRGIAGAVNGVLKLYKSDESMLIQILLMLQSNFGWLPTQMLREVSKQLEIPLSRVYEVATFYKVFSLSPRGKHLIRTCAGTSCEVRGATTILDQVQSILGVEKGETTLDGKFSLETVNCLGCCALGPVMTIDGEYYEKIKLPEVKKILSRYK